MEVYEYGDPSAAVVLLQPVFETDTMEKEIELIREGTEKEFVLRAFKVADWNKDLSPWEAPAVFGREDFGSGAAETLKEMLNSCNDDTKSYYIGGYSLAGLFSLWASFQTDRFRAVAAASPSMWFPGFTEYMKEHKPRCAHVYLSLGDKEEKARNPVMASVGERMRAAYAGLKEQGVDCTLEWNEGNHFKDAALRTAKAFSWTLERKKTIRVVAALIRSLNSEGKPVVFATRRGYGDYKGGWEFPGGKIEPGETPQQALCREIREELTAEISTGSLLKTIEYDYPAFHLSMDCFWAEIRSGELVLKEAEAARWLTAGQLDEVDWLPADRELIDGIRKEL